MIELEKTPIEGLLKVRTKVFEDSRGLFYEGYREDRYAAAGLPTHFVQDNCSYSKKNVLRGLHFQEPKAQGKLIRCIAGHIYDVAVDIRPLSKTFGQHFGLELDDGKNKGIAFYVPGGFAHGFAVLSEDAWVQYKCTELYSPADEKGFRWDDPSLRISWPLKNPLLSEKDENYSPFRDYARSLGVADFQRGA